MSLPRPFFLVMLACLLCSAAAVSAQTTGKKKHPRHHRRPAPRHRGAHGPGVSPVQQQKLLRNALHEKLTPGIKDSLKNHPIK